MDLIHGVSCLKGETHALITLMRLNTRWATRGTRLNSSYPTNSLHSTSSSTTIHHPTISSSSITSSSIGYYYYDEEDPHIQSFRQLNEYLEGLYILEDVDVLKYITPFHNIIISEAANGQLTSAALSSLSKFALYGFFHSNYPRMKEAMALVAHSISQCVFEESDNESDELILMKLLELSALVFRCHASILLSIDAAWDIYNTCLSIHNHINGSKILKSEAETALVHLTLNVFTRASAMVSMVSSSSLSSSSSVVDEVRMRSSSIENHQSNSTAASSSASSSAAAATSSVMMMTSDHLEEETLNTLTGVTTMLLKVIRILCNKLDQPKTNRDGVKFGLFLINVALEAGGPALNSITPLVHILCNDMCRHLLRATQSDDLGVFSSSLRVVFNLFMSMKQHMKVQLEVFLSSVHLRLLNHSIGVISAREELALESLLEFCREPSLMQDLYANYDCDVQCSNVFDHIVGTLCRRSVVDIGKLPETPLGTSSLNREILYGKNNMSTIENGNGNNEMNGSKTVLDRFAKPPRVTVLHRLAFDGLLAVLNSLGGRVQATAASRRMLAVATATGVYNGISRMTSGVSSVYGEADDSTNPVSTGADGVSVEGVNSIDIWSATARAHGTDSTPLSQDDGEPFSLVPPQELESRRNSICAVVGDGQSSPTSGGWVELGTSTNQPEVLSAAEAAAVAAMIERARYTEDLRARKQLKRRIRAVTDSFNERPFKAEWLRIALESHLITALPSSVTFCPTQGPHLDSPEALAEATSAAEQARKLFLSADPASIAQFLRKTPGLSKTQIGEYLSKGPVSDWPFYAAVRYEFSRTFDFEGSAGSFQGSLRAFLTAFRLPGEAQCIDRLMEAFARRYFEKFGSGKPFASSDAVFVLAFSTIMLNTDMYNRQIPASRRMTKAQFVSNNRGINEGEDLPREFIEGVYDDIRAAEIRLDMDPRRLSEGAGTGGAGGGSATSATSGVGAGNGGGVDFSDSAQWSQLLASCNAVAAPAQFTAVNVASGRRRRLSTAGPAATDDVAHHVGHAHGSPTDQTTPLPSIIPHTGAMPVPTNSGDVPGQTSTSAAAVAAATSGLDMLAHEADMFLAISRSAFTTLLILFENTADDALLRRVLLGLRSYLTVAATLELNERLADMTSTSSVVDSNVGSGFSSTTTSSSMAVAASAASLVGKPPPLSFSSSRSTGATSPGLSAPSSSCKGLFSSAMVVLLTRVHRLLTQSREISVANRPSASSSSGNNALPTSAADLLSHRQLHAQWRQTYGRDLYHSVKLPIPGGSFAEDCSVYRIKAKKSNNQISTKEKFSGADKTDNSSGKLGTTEWADWAEAAVVRTELLLRLLVRLAMSHPMEMTREAWDTLLSVLLYARQRGALPDDLASISHEWAFGGTRRPEEDGNDSEADVLVDSAPLDSNASVPAVVVPLIPTIAHRQALLRHAEALRYGGDLSISIHRLESPSGATIPPTLSPSNSSLNPATSTSAVGSAGESSSNRGSGWSTSWLSSLWSPRNELADAEANNASAYISFLLRLLSPDGGLQTLDAEARQRLFILNVNPYVDSNGELLRTDDGLLKSALEEENIWASLRNVACFGSSGFDMSLESPVGCITAPEEVSTTLFSGLVFTLGSQLDGCRGGKWSQALSYAWQTGYRCEDVSVVPEYCPSSHVSDELFPHNLLPPTNGEEIRIAATELDIVLILEWLVGLVWSSPATWNRLHLRLAAVIGTLLYPGHLDLAATISRMPFLLERIAVVVLRGLSRCLNVSSSSSTSADTSTDATVSSQDGVVGRVYWEILRLLTSLPPETLLPHAGTIGGGLSVLLKQIHAQRTHLGAMQWDEIFHCITALWPVYEGKKCAWECLSLLVSEDLVGVGNHRHCRRVLMEFLSLPSTNGMELQYTSTSGKEFHRVGGVIPTGVEAVAQAEWTSNAMLCLLRLTLMSLAGYLYASASAAAATTVAVANVDGVQFEAITSSDVDIGIPDESRQYWTALVTSIRGTGGRPFVVFPSPDLIQTAPAIAQTLITVGSLPSSTVGPVPPTESLSLPALSPLPEVERSSLSWLSVPLLPCTSPVETSSQWAAVAILLADFCGAPSVSVMHRAVYCLEALVSVGLLVGLPASCWEVTIGELWKRLPLSLVQTANRLGSEMSPSDVAETSYRCCALAFHLLVRLTPVLRANSTATPNLSTKNDHESGEKLISSRVHANPLAEDTNQLFTKLIASYKNESPMCESLSEETKEVLTQLLGVCVNLTTSANNEKEVQLYEKFYIKLVSTLASNASVCVRGEMLHEEMVAMILALFRTLRLPPITSKSQNEVVTTSAVPSASAQSSSTEGVASDVQTVDNTPSVIVSSNSVPPVAEVSSPRSSGGMLSGVLSWMNPFAYSNSAPPSAPSTTTSTNVADAKKEVSPPVKEDTTPVAASQIVEQAVQSTSPDVSPLAEVEVDPVNDRLLLAEAWKVSTSMYPALNALIQRRDAVFHSKILSTLQFLEHPPISRVAGVSSDTSRSTVVHPRNPIPVNTTSVLPPALTIPLSTASVDVSPVPPPSTTRSLSSGKVQVI